jgi:pyrimidine-nucleoside phosphorylase
VFQDIIQKKRDNLELTKADIDYFISEYTKNSIPDYQASALLMAIYLNGMSNQEISNLTLAMANSGETYNYPANLNVVDKHSSGGVGDKITLVSLPIAAACGVNIAKISGRGLGFTGGTADKLRAFNMNLSLTEQDFIDKINNNGCAIMESSINIAPADKKLYSLRDATSTVDSLPLIAASIMSKKLATGAPNLVLDVKFGSGALMKTAEKATQLAQQMIDIAKFSGRNAVALITNMDEPLGTHVGNNLEVIEAINTLNGNGDENFTQLSVEIATYMVMLGLKIDHDSALQLAQTALKNGSALNKLKQIIQAQSGVFVPDAIKTHSSTTHILAQTSGFVTHINAQDIGNASMHLGAGRNTIDDDIDLTVGVLIHAKVGTSVNCGDKLATLYGNPGDETIRLTQNAFTVGNTPPKKIPMIYKVLT